MSDDAACVPLIIPMCKHAILICICILLNISWCHLSLSVVSGWPNIVYPASMFEFFRIQWDHICVLQVLFIYTPLTTYVQRGIHHTNTPQFKAPRFHIYKDKLLSSWETEPQKYTSHPHFEHLI